MTRMEVFSPDLATKGIIKKGHIYIRGSGYRPVTYSAFNNLAIFEGDIVLCTEDKMREFSLAVETAQREKSSIAYAISVISSIGNLWPNAILPYELDNGVYDATKIHQAIALVENRTPLRFFRRREGDQNYIRFVPSDGCSSYVGMIGGMQRIWLADWATVGAIVHEILHAAGLWHEHSRADRNHYVVLHLGNLKDPNDKHNFDQHINDGRDLGTYDYGSIMHYSRTAFAKSGKVTIEPIDPSANIGNRDEPSEKDELGLRDLYLFNNLDPIVDVIIIEGNHPDLSPPDDFTRISQDLNQGSGGKYLYLCFRKEPNPQPDRVITDLMVISGNSPYVQAPQGYTKIDVDTNSGAGGKYVYVCYKKGNGIPITNIAVVAGGSDESADAGYGFVKVPKDLNEGAGGKYIYLCFQPDPNAPIEDITLITHLSVIFS